MFARKPQVQALEKARELKSRYRQGELKNPVTAFQRWLQRSYKEAL